MGDLRDVYVYIYIHGSERAESNKSRPLDPLSGLGSGRRMIFFGVGVPAENLRLNAQVYVCGCVGRVEKFVDRSRVKLAGVWGRTLRLLSLMRRLRASF